MWPGPTGCPWWRVKYGFLEFLSKKNFFWRHQMTSDFLHISRTENFPLVTRRNCSKSSLDPKRGSEFAKEYSLTGFKKCPISNFFFHFRNKDLVLPRENPRVPVRKNCLISLIWRQEERLIIRKLFSIKFKLCRKGFCWTNLAHF